MSILIKGMEMPLEKPLVIQIYPEGTVRRLDGSIYNSHFEAVPAADVRPVVRGKWENTGSDVWKCSACGYGIMPWNAGVNFCPNCGAVMEVSSDG